MSRAFYRWSGGTPADHEALAWFSSATPGRMGPLVARFRGGIGVGAWVRIVGVGLGVGVVLGVLVLLLAPGAALVAAVAACAVTVVVAVLAATGALLAARRYRYDVHAHGLVLRGLRGGYDVLPWASLDPGRVFIARSVRAMTRMPIALHRQRAAFPPGVVLNGWTNSPTGTHEAVEAFAGGYRYQPTAGETPFGWWQLGVTDPAALLGAIEHAMVADGYAAAGLTPFALSRRYSAGDLRRDPTIQRERQLTDPVIGLPTAARPSPAGPAGP